MFDNCSYKILLICLFIFLIILLFISNIDHIFGGAGKEANCLICTNISYNGNISNWTLSHFVLFLILGMICPDNILLIISIGVLWEFVELYFEYVSKLNHESILCEKEILKSCTNKMSSDAFWEHYLGIKEHPYTLFWCSSGLNGQIIDILADVAGVLLGSYIAKKYLI